MAKSQTRKTTAPRQDGQKPAKKTPRKAETFLVARETEINEQFVDGPDIWADDEEDM